MPKSQPQIDRLENLKQRFRKSLPFYNVPNNCFVNNRQDTYIKVLNWLGENLDSSFIGQNEMLNLFGNKPEQWKLEDAEYFIQSLIKFWKDW